MSDEGVTNRRRRAPIWGGGLAAFTGQPPAYAPQPMQPAPGLAPSASQPQAYPTGAPQGSYNPMSTRTPALVPAVRPNLPPDQALQRLMEGNRRFVSQPQICAANLAAARLADQAPYAVILSCSDSRMAPELIFGGVGPGEIFVARNAGNLADEFTIGSIELGAGYLGASVVMVLAHQSCGAVQAACDVVIANSYYPPSIEALVQPIIPAALAVRGYPGDFVTNALRESARRTARRIVERSAILRDLTQQGRLQVVAADYSFETGVVELL